MLLSALFSKPAKNCADVLGREYVRIRIWLKSDSGLSSNPVYEAHFFTKTQVFQKKMTLAECDDFYKTHAGTTFKTVVQYTETEEITLLTNRHGKQTVLRKKRAAAEKNTSLLQKSACEKKEKNYPLPEGEPLLFLIRQGVMTDEGKVIAQKYDKFRQINKFVSFVDDIIPAVRSLSEKDGDNFCENRPLRIIDFGCGKSYATFALYHYLTVVKKIPTEIVGLDLKADVIASCTALAKECGYEHLHFFTGDIASFSKNMPTPDIVITLHACDTATDYALHYAISSNVKALLSVPCCQHEINAQLKKGSVPNENPFAPFLRYGLIKERFSSLLTDVLRAELLEQYDYSVQVLEFIDMEYTPKNVLLRAVKKQVLTKKASAENEDKKERSKERLKVIFDHLPVSQSLYTLLSNEAETRQKNPL